MKVYCLTCERWRHRNSIPRATSSQPWETARKRLPNPKKSNSPEPLPGLQYMHERTRDELRRVGDAIQLEEDDLSLLVMSHDARQAAHSFRNAVVVALAIVMALTLAFTVQIAWLASF